MGLKFGLGLALLAMVIGVVQWRAAHRETEFETANPPTGNFINVNGTRVHYRIIGAGPDLVMLHGASGNLNDFTLGFTDLLQDRYRIILFDRPGLGWTGRLPGHGGAWNTAEESPAEQAALLQAAADALGVEDPIVLGHSFGSAIALAWGVSRPDRTAAMVLVAGVAEPWPGKLSWLHRVNSTKLGGAVVVPLITGFAPKSAVTDGIASTFVPQHPPAGYGEHLGTELVLRRTSARANAQQVNKLRPHIVEMQKKYGDLHMPIEIIHGTADTIVPADIHAKVLINDIPDGVLTLLDGIGHMPQHSAAGDVVAAIDRAAARSGLR